MEDKEIGSGGGREKGGRSRSVTAIATSMAPTAPSPADVSMTASLGTAGLTLGVPTTPIAPTPIKAILHDDPKIRNKAAKAAGAIDPTTRPKPVLLFSHLAQFEGRAFGSGGELLQLQGHPHSGIHPSIIRFALRSAAFLNKGSSRRCQELMLAFKDAIRDYRASADMAISRHLDLHIKRMVGFIVDARPLAVSMSHAIRGLRFRISTIPPETAEHEAQQILYSYMDSYMSSRLIMASRAIINYALPKIVDGDVILTFARSVVVRDLLIAAKEAGRNFRVIVVDSRPFEEGRELLNELVSYGLLCTYVRINALGYIMRQVSKTIIGAAGMYANGALLSRVGTASVCSLSRRFNIPVIVCCEILKFSERSQNDSFVFNELGDPDALVRIGNTHSSISAPPSTQPSFGQKAVLENWRDQDHLRLLNIIYDVTPAECITVVVTEIGLIPVTSVPVVLREYNSTSQYTN